MQDKTVWQTRNLDDHLSRVASDILNQAEHVFINPFIVPNFHKTGKLSGAVVSVKATFDVAGYPTTMGSRLLGGRAASVDAEVITRLKQEGASLIGHTNMTELAYSGVGLNPHYGTPENPHLKNRITGGSTSGGAVSVASGLADMALGTDTGGSLRIPAAFCGLVGFKPSQQSVSREGCLPLSESLDSIGVMANNVHDCELVWRTLGKASESPNFRQAPCFKIANNFGLTDLSPEVEKGFNAVLTLLQQQGILIQKEENSLFENYKQLPVWQFSAVESRRYYQQSFDLNSELLDPRVRQRIARGESVSNEEFAGLKSARNELIKAFEKHENNSVFLMPTVACTAPKLTDFESDEDFNRVNLLCLRNTSFANVIDGCSISLPFVFEGEQMGLMLTSRNGFDINLLAIAKRFEQHLALL